jgi:hypothetical protein
MSTHAVAIATVRSFAAQSGAERVVLLLDEGEDARATMIEWRAGEPVELTIGGVTELVEGRAAPETAALDLPEIRPLPASAIEVDAEQGRLSAPLGAVAQLAQAVLGLAAAFGGRSVATAEFVTRDPERPLTIAARPGEPIVASLDDETYAFPEGWP